MVRIEFLYFVGCPGKEPAFELLEEALAREGLRGEVSRIEVPGPEAAERFRFVGSPSIRVNGVDLEGPEVEAELGYGWRCRRYSDSQPGHPDSVPAANLIRRRLREAAAAERS